LLVAFGRHASRQCWRPRGDDQGLAALRDRGIPEPTASLTAETGIAVFKVAFARWVSEPGQPDLTKIFRQSMAELRGVLAVDAPV
jgi:hypothetical protein